MFGIHSACRYREREMLMPTDSIIVIVPAVAAFSIFAGALFWADLRTHAPKAQA
jgi:hypothetical protein